MQLKTPESEIDKFVYVVSHDLQEPIRTVEGFLRLLLLKHGENLPEEAKQYLDFARQGNEKLKNMVQKLTDLSRVNRSEEEIVAIDYGVFLRDIVTLYEGKIEEIHIDENLPTLNARSGQLLKLSRILLDNVVHHNSNACTLHVSAKQSEDKIEIKFADTGVGVASNVRDKIFDIFYALSPDKKRLGTGLTIAKAIVENHGGEMRSEDNFPSGLAIYFSWKN